MVEANNSFQSTKQHLPDQKSIEEEEVEKEAEEIKEGQKESNR